VSDEPGKTDGEPPRLQDTTERAAMPLPLPDAPAGPQPGDWIPPEAEPEPDEKAESSEPKKGRRAERKAAKAEKKASKQAEKQADEPAEKQADEPADEKQAPAEKSQNTEEIELPPPAPEPAPEPAPATTTFKAAPRVETPKPPPMPDLGPGAPPAGDKPEAEVAGAFAGGLVAALVLRRLVSRRDR
jgi:hypothetical protein